MDKDWLRAQPKALFRVDLRSHLALFRISKVIYKEAFPCFYSQNFFYIPNDFAFLKLFQTLSDRQFCYLEHIVWRSTNTEAPPAKLVQQFAALPRLRTLVFNLRARDHIWYRNARSLSVSDVPHLTIIKGLQEVKFFGPVAAHEHCLRSQMVGWRDRTGPDLA
jgi:hypothetical protein